MKLGRWCPIDRLQSRGDVQWERESGREREREKKRMGGSENLFIDDEIIECKLWGSHIFYNC